VSDYENIDGVTEWDLLVQRIREMEDPEAARAQAMRDARSFDDGWKARVPPSRVRPAREQAPVRPAARGSHPQRVRRCQPQGDHAGPARRGDLADRRRHPPIPLEGPLMSVAMERYEQPLALIQSIDDLARLSKQVADSEYYQGHEQRSPGERSS
jgi:hypothetical protein